MADKTNTTETGSSLTDFNFDTQETFFGLNAEGQEVAEENGGNLKETILSATDDDDDGGVTNLDEIKKPTSTPKPTTKKADASGEATKGKREDKGGKKEENEEEEEVKFFAEEETTTSDRKEGEENTDEFYPTLAKELVEEGIFTSDKIKVEDIKTKEDLINANRTEIEEGIESGIREMFKSMPQEAKDLMKHLQNNGKVSDFLVVYGDALETEGLDMDNEADREKVLVHQLTVIEGLDATETADRIKYLKDQGKEKLYAEKYLANISKEQEDNKKALADEAAENEKKRKQSAKAFVESVNNTFSERVEVGSIVINPKDSKELIPYVAQPTVQNGNKKITPLVSEIMKILSPKTPEDFQKLIALGKAVKNDFKIDAIPESQRSKKIKEAQDNLKSARVKHTTSSGANGSSRNVADYFD